MLFVAVLSRKSNAAALSERSNESKTPVAVPPVSVLEMLPVFVTINESAAVPPVRLSKPLKVTDPMVEFERFPAFVALMIHVVAEFGPMRTSVMVGRFPPIKFSMPLKPPVEVAVLV